MAIADLRRKITPSFGFFVLLLLSHTTYSVLRNPFPLGYSMGNLGAIMDKRGMEARQPWVSAAPYADTLNCGLTLATLWYYDQMDNYSNRYTYQSVLGGWYDWNACTFKTALSFFSSLATYFEESIYLSTGFEIVPYLRISADVSGNRIGLMGDDESRHTVIKGGSSLWISWQYACVLLQVDNVTHRVLDDGSVAPPLVFRCGVHTVRNMLGSQGVVVEVTPSLHDPISFRFGEELWVHRRVAIHGGLATNPFLIAFGVVLQLPSSGVGTALVSHPTLGWSKGFFVDYAR